MEVETITRQLLGTYFLRAWLGPLLDQKTYCAASVQGSDFDPDVAADTAPFTPAEVRGGENVSGVGWIRLTFHEVDRFADGVSGGVQDLGAGPVPCGGETTLIRCEFEIAVPSDRHLTVEEGYAAQIRRLFDAVSIPYTGPPKLTLRNLRMYPTHLRKGADDGTWRRSYVDVRIRRHERRAQAGTKTVALPT